MRYLLAAPFLALVAGLLLAQPPLPDEPPPLPDGIDVQARGTVHEAYADTGSTVRPAAGLVVNREPPRLVDELPPEDRPAGDNVVWVGGYWGFDEEANDFVWVSGFWRAVPPGRSWLPGHWQRVPAGWQWVAGYWGQPTVTEVEYLPPPPESLERGPSGPVPAGNQTYVPGIWMWQTNRYLWRPGYHIAHRPNWVWVPSTYRWTPAGHVFVAGYWDAPLLDRGLLFAPVRIDRRLYLRPGFVYRPAYVVQPDFMVGALFVRPGRPCYYFGDFFEARYRPLYTPWVSYRPYRAVVDVNFGYYRHSFARHAGWERGVTGLYTARYAGDVPRPPRTLVAQTTVIRGLAPGRANVVVRKDINITHVQNVTVVSPLRRSTTVAVTGLTGLAATRPGAPATVVREVRVERVSPTRLADERRAIERERALAAARRTQTTTLITKMPAKGPTAPVRVKVDLPKGTPPPRMIRSTVTAPPRPTAPKVIIREERPKGTVKDRDRPKDRR